MRLYLAALVTLLGTSPVHAASGPFFSLGNTDFIVTVSFLLFVASVIYFKAPGFVAKLIDGRIDVIRRRIDEAIDIRNEAQSRLSQSEEHRAKALVDAEQIRQRAVAEAIRAREDSEQALRDLAVRRMDDARERIAVAEAEAIERIRNESIEVAVDVAAEVIASSMDRDDRRAATASSIAAIDQNLQKGL